jgi:hypothetical protein
MRPKESQPPMSQFLSKLWTQSDLFKKKRGIPSYLTKLFDETYSRSPAYLRRAKLCERLRRNAPLRFQTCFSFF